MEQLLCTRWMVPGRPLCTGDRHFDNNTVRIHLHCCSGREEILNFPLIMKAWNVKWFFQELRQNWLIFPSFQLTGPLMSLFGPDGIFLYFASVTSFYVFSFCSIAFSMSLVSDLWFFLGLCPQHCLRGDHGSRDPRGNLLSLPNQRELSKTSHYPENLIKKGKNFLPI